MDQSRVPFLFTQPQWTAAKRRMHDGDQHQVCSHSDQMRTSLDGRILGFWLQCGEGRRAGDVYVISAYAPVHDERTQTVASGSLRLEFWRHWTESFVRSQADVD